MLFVFGVIGLTNILVHGKILDLIKFHELTLRQWTQVFDFTKELLNCYECTGGWSGLIMGCIIIMASGQSWIFIIPYIFAGSLVSGFYSELIFLIRSKTDFVLDEEKNGKTESQ